MGVLKESLLQRVTCEGHRGWGSGRTAKRLLQQQVRDGSDQVAAEKVVRRNHVLSIF